MHFDGCALCAWRSTNYRVSYFICSIFFPHPLKMSFFRGGGKHHPVLRFMSVPSRWRSHWSLLVRDHCQPILPFTFLKHFYKFVSASIRGFHYVMWFFFFFFLILKNWLCFQGCVLQDSPSLWVTLPHSLCLRWWTVNPIPSCLRFCTPHHKAVSSGATLFITPVFPPHFFRSRTKVCGFTQMV